MFDCFLLFVMFVVSIVVKRSFAVKSIHEDLWHRVLCPRSTYVLRHEISKTLNSDCPIAQVGYLGAFIANWKTRFSIIDVGIQIFYFFLIFSLTDRVNNNYSFIFHQFSLNSVYPFTLNQIHKEFTFQKFIIKQNTVSYWIFPWFFAILFWISIVVSLYVVKEANGSLSEDWEKRSCWWRNLRCCL